MKTNMLHRCSSLAPEMSSTFPSILPVLPVWVGTRRVPPQIRNTLCTNHIKQQLPTKHWPRRELERGTSRNPFIFYGPFGDSSALPSSILKWGPTPLTAPTCGWTQWGETQIHVLWRTGEKVDVPHTPFSFLLVNICTVMLFSKCWSKTQLFLSCLQFWPLPDLPTTHQGPLGHQIAYTAGHGAPGTFELMN